jgi:hypothetical protein
VNGPAILSGPKAASIWIDVLGKEVKYAGDNLDTFEEQMRQHAAGSWQNVAISSNNTRR